MTCDPNDKTAVDLFGGGVSPRDTREKLIHTAMNLFYAYGFHGVRIDQIITEVGVTKTTFYNHFESKDDLMIAVIKQRDEWEMRAFTKHVQAKAGYDPRAMLLAMFDVLHDWFNHPDYQGCLFITACSEFPSRSDPVHQAASRHYAAAFKTICDMAKAIGIEDVESFAEEWITLLEGAVTYRLVNDDDNAASISKRIAERRLEDYATRKE